MSVVALLALVVVGLVVGFTSGLVGIGGGVLIVPFLYFFYGHPALSGYAIPPALHTVAAHATSLFVIVPTAIRGAHAYSKAGLVVWKAALPIGVVSVLAAVAGSKLAMILPSNAVRLGFGVFLLLTGVQILWRPSSVERRPLVLRPAAVIGTGFLVGLLSGVMGIGGGAVAAPLLIYLFGLDLKQAAATSLAVVGLAAIAGTITYAIEGLGVRGMPPGSVGHVNVLSALPLLAGSLISVKWGARTNQRMAAEKLKIVFSTFFVVLGLYLIWQNA